MRRSLSLRWGAVLVFLLMVELLGGAFLNRGTQVLLAQEGTPRPTPTNDPGDRPTPTTVPPTVVPTDTPTPMIPTDTPSPATATPPPPATEVPQPPPGPESPGGYAPPEAAPTPTATPFVATRLPRTGLMDYGTLIPMALAVLALVATLIAARTLREQQDDETEA